MRSDEDEPTPEAVQRALHDVVARCIYGVDMNDLAAELAKVSLWLEALESGKPLGFLDARIRVGNSLFGTTPALIAGGVPDAAFKEIEGDSKAFAAEVRKRNKNEATGQGLLSWVDPDALAAANRRERALLLAPSDDVDDIRAQGEAWDAYLTSDARQTLKRQADAWAAAFVWPLHDGTPLPPTTAVVRAMLDDDAAVRYLDTVDGVDRLASEYRFFHWHLEFPEVFGATTGDGLGPEGWAGGFSCMLGNPPWEQIELKETEFFAARDPEIATATGAKRKSLIAKLAAADPILDKEYRAEKRSIDALRKFVSTGRFPLTGRGRVNTYSVFAELFRGVTGPNGRAGIIVPTGVATDATTQFFFRALVESRSLSALYDFQNAGKRFFANVHADTPFCMLVSTGRLARTRQAKFAFGLLDPLRIPEREFVLTHDEIMMLNPNTGTVPTFRSRRDADIVLSVYRRLPILIERGNIASNVWSLSFQQGLFNMTSDSDRFRTRDELVSGGWKLDGNFFVRDGMRMWPLYESKMIHQMDSRWASESGEGFVDVSDALKADPKFHAVPRYWVSEQDLRGERASLEPALAYRLITNPANERTLIASLVPPVAFGHSVALTEAAVADALVLLAVMNSFALDFIVRQKLSGKNLNFFLIDQLPVPRPETFETSAPWCASIRLDDWIRSRVKQIQLNEDWSDYGVEGLATCVFEREKRDVLSAELDAAIFHLYGMDDADIDYVLDSFPVLRRRDIEQFGEYRTKRLILENHDRMQECIDTGTEFVSTLDPAPGFGPRHPERTTDA